MCLDETISIVAPSPPLIKVSNYIRRKGRGWANFRLSDLAGQLINVMIELAVSRAERTFFVLEVGGGGALWWAWENMEICRALSVWPEIFSYFIKVPIFMASP